MRKIVVSQFISLNGVMEAPEIWNSNYRDNKEVVKEILNDFSVSDALLFGRTTYEQFASRWPQRTDEMAGYFNALPKYVVSTSMQNAEWRHSTVINADVYDAVQQLKQQPGKNILLFGSHRLVQALMAHQLIDEYKLYVYPLTLGAGKRLFTEESAPLTMKLVSARSLTGGVVSLTYQSQ